MKKIMDGVMVAPKDNTIKGADVKHLDTTDNVAWLAMNDLQGKATIIGNLLQGAINLAKGNVAVATISDSEVYFEFTMANNDKILAILDEETETVKYSGNVDLESTDEAWPLGAIVTYLCLDDETRKNAEFHRIFSKIQDEKIASKETCFQFCSYVLSRIAQKNKRNLNIDMPEKVRNINEKDGEVIKVVKDLTPDFSGIPGIFEGINASSMETNTNETFSSLVGTGYYNLNVDLTESEKTLVPKVVYIPERVEKYILNSIKTFSELGLYQNYGLHGPTGCGKSFSTTQIAGELGIPCYSLALDDNFDVNAALGSRGINSNGETYFEKSWLAKAIESPCVIEFAEFNAAYATRLTKLYDLIDTYKGVTMLDDNSVLRRHPLCIFIFTCNVGYRALNDMAQSLPARFICNVELARPNRTELKTICNNQIAGKKIDDDIKEYVIDFYEQVEEFLKVGSINGTIIPKTCENSLRGYAYFMAVLQMQRDSGCYNPIEAAKATILPMVTAAADYNKNLVEEFANVVSTTFEFFEK